MSRILIIGGSDAGISAGLRAIQLDPSRPISIVLAASFPNYSICGLPFYVSGETPDWHDLAHRSYEELASQGLELLLDHQAVQVDAAAKVVALVDRQGRRPHKARFTVANSVANPTDLTALNGRVGNAESQKFRAEFNCRPICKQAVRARLALA